MLIRTGMVLLVVGPLLGACERNSESEGAMSPASGTDSTRQTAPSEIPREMEEGQESDTGMGYESGPGTTGTESGTTESESVPGATGTEPGTTGTEPGSGTMGPESEPGMDEDEEESQ